MNSVCNCTDHPQPCEFCDVMIPPRSDHECSGPDALELRKRLAHILKSSAAEVRPCRACGQMLYFVPSKAGKRQPFTLDGLNHFANCPDAERFRRQA